MNSVQNSAWTLAENGERQMKNALIDDFLLNNQHLQPAIETADCRQYSLVEHELYGLTECCGVSFIKTRQHLFTRDGPLAFKCRHFIAIIAAKQRECQELVDLHTAEFLLHDGDESWLIDTECVPQKLRDFGEINHILVHRPWLLTNFHIAKLRQCPGSWSLSELMQAIVILAHTHALSSFIAGCGAASVLGAGIPTDKPTDVLPTILATIKSNDLYTSVVRDTLKNANDLQNVLSNSSPLEDTDILCYLQHPDTTYQQFLETTSHSELTSFSANDYAWQDHGYSLVSRLYPDIGNFLDEEFRLAQNIPYSLWTDNGNTLTGISRCQAVWKFIHLQFGIRHDDYDYNQINTLLPQHTRSYLKTLTCFPEKLSHANLSMVLNNIPHTEKMKLNLLVLEARLQVELLYSLRAIDRSLCALVVH